MVLNLDELNIYVINT